MFPHVFQIYYYFPEDKDYLWIFFKSNSEPNILNAYKDVHKNDKEGTFLRAMLVIFVSL